MPFDENLFDNNEGDKKIDNAVDVEFERFGSTDEASDDDFLNQVGYYDDAAEENASDSIGTDEALNEEKPENPIDELFSQAPVFDVSGIEENNNKKTKTTKKRKKKGFRGFKGLKGLIRLPRHSKNADPKLIFTACLAIMLVALILFTVFSEHGINVFGRNTLYTTEAIRGDIAVTVESNGVVCEGEQYEVNSLVSGKITDDNFDEGDTVKKGEVLYSFDTTDIDNRIAIAEKAVDKAELDYDSTLGGGGITTQNVSASAGGIIRELYVAEGEAITKGAKIAKVSSTDKLLLTVPFIAADAKNIHAGEACELTLENTFSQIKGVVNSISTISSVTSYGAETRNVLINVNNPGAIKPGDKATVFVGDIACNDAGTFSYAEETVITSTAAGEILQINYSVNDKISKGSRLLSVYNAQNEKKTDVKSNKAAVDEAKLTLQALKDERENYEIVAPVTGKIIEKNIKKGEIVNANNQSKPMAVIADTRYMIIEAQVSQDNISKIKKSQKASFYDGTDSEKILGRVSSIGNAFTDDNGNTSFLVKIKVNQLSAKNLIAGMKLKLDIIVKEKTNVIKIPVSALNDGNIVFVKELTEEEKNNKQSSSPDKDNSDDFGYSSPNNSDDFGYSSPNNSDDFDNNNSGYSDSNGENGIILKADKPQLMPYTDSQTNGYYMGSDIPAELAEGIVPDNETAPGNESVPAYGEMISPTVQPGSGNDSFLPQPSADAFRFNDDSSFNDFGSSSSLATEKPDVPVIDDKSMEERLKGLKVPKGYKAVVITTGLSDGTYIEVINGLSDGDTVIISKPLDIIPSSSPVPAAGKLTK